MIAVPRREKLVQLSDRRRDGSLHRCVADVDEVVRIGAGRRGRAVTRDERREQELMRLVAAARRLPNERRQLGHHRRDASAVGMVGARCVIDARRECRRRDRTRHLQNGATAGDVVDGRGARTVREGECLTIASFRDRQSRELDERRRGIVLRRQGGAEVLARASVLVIEPPRDDTEHSLGGRATRDTGIARGSTKRVDRGAHLLALQGLLAAQNQRDALA